MKKDTRKSAPRMATYGQKMKALGYKQVSFYMSPKAHSSITTVTVETKILNASLASTANTLFEALTDKYFVYQAITNRANPYEMVEAIDKTIKFLQKIRKENEEWIAAENAEFEARLEHIGHDAYQKEQEFQAKLDWDANEANY